MRNLLKSLQSQLAMRRLIFTDQGEILCLDASRGEVTAMDAAIAQRGKRLMEGERVQVNGRLVPLSSPVQHGDRVNVITRATTAASSTSSFPTPIVATPMNDGPPSGISSRRSIYSWTRPVSFKEVS